MCGQSPSRLGQTCRRAPNSAQFNSRSDRKVFSANRSWYGEGAGVRDGLCFSCARNATSGAWHILEFEGDGIARPRRIFVRAPLSSKGEWVRRVATSSAARQPLSGVGHVSLDQQLGCSKRKHASQLPRHPVIPMIPRDQWGEKTA